jgi:hypothetical protein
LEETVEMKNTFVWQRPASLFTVMLAALLFVVPSRVQAQGGRGGGQAPAAPPTGQSASMVDLTGYWETIITEDWRWRMVTPPKGDYQSVTLNNAARAVADAWDPDKDTAAGLQCKSYGAAAVMRVPGRIHITWKDANTLQIDTEAGTQTRLLHFDHGAVQGERETNGELQIDRNIASYATPPASETGTWQGYSSAHWVLPGVLGAGVNAGGGGGRGGARLMPSTMKVVTTHMRAGYLRKNGVPYSENAVVTEYFNVLQEADGGPWLIVTNFVDDPMYLAQPFATSTHYRKLADGSAWKPEPCVAK